MSIDYSKFESIIRESFRISKLPLERCSQVLLSQLAHMPDYGGINHPYQFVEHEIRHLEGNGKTQTKEATLFKSNGKLAGFKHKHFYVPGYEHLAVNTLINWKLNDTKSKKFTQMALEIAKPYRTTKDYNTDEEKLNFSKDLAHVFIYGKEGVLKRFEKEKATGDWLVFVEYGGLNYYLCIAKHDEDDFIIGAIKNCVIDFPFLENLLANSNSNI